MSTVTSTLDDGSAGTLRYELAHASSGDVIDFNIAGGGTQHIQLSRPLPAITAGNLTIDGTTQAGYAGSPLVWIDGMGLDTDGLTLQGDSSWIKGIGITGFGRSGVVLVSSSNTVGGTLPGQGDVISGNTGNGILVEGHGNTIEGNLIGTDATGSMSMGNGGDGVFAMGNANNLSIIGNVISANGGDGITLDGPSGVLVSGNFIGTNAAGNAIADAGGNNLGNAGNGISINFGASNDTVGGSDAADRNLISGNADGVRIATNATSSGILVQGNYIGTDADGATALSNVSNGVTVQGSNVNIIGNVLSGNGAYGAQLLGDSNTVQGDLIGTQADGIGPLGNPYFDGILIAGSNNTIGGVQAGQGNTIAFNYGDGVAVQSGTGNSIRGNSIYSNSVPDNSYPSIGIDLGYDGVTLNDSAGHVGPNNFQDFPVITSAAVQEGTTTLHATLSGAAGGEIVDFYTSKSADPTGYGQGQFYLGSAVVDTNGACALAVSNVPAGQNFFTATATDSLGNTSEFSAALPSFTVYGPTVTPTTTTLASSSPDHSTYGRQVTFTATVSSSGGVPTGSVQFEVNSTVVDTEALDGTGHASFTISTLAAGSYDIVAVYNGGGVFQTSASNHVTQVVNKADAVITLTPYSVTYDGAAHTAAGTATGVMGETLSGLALGGTTHTNAGSYTDAWTFTDVTGNYNTANGSVADNIAAAPLTVTANNATRVYGTPNPVFSVTPIGFVNGDTMAGLTGTLSFATTATVSSQAGSYSVTPGGLGSSNYAITFAGGTLTITKATPLLAWANPADITSGTALGGTQLNATAGVPGSFVYTPAAGTVLGTGKNQTLSAAFTPTDTTDYNTASATVAINVLAAQASGSVSGHVYNDVTGNGLSSDDTPMPGVTVKLFRDRNGNRRLDPGDGAAVQTTTTDAKGAYSFSNLTPGSTYVVQEVTPGGYIRTAPVRSETYAVTGLTSATGLDFDNFNKACCTNSVKNVSFLVNGKRTVSDLHGATHQGDTVTVRFTVTGAAPQRLSLVTYDAPGPSSHAHEAGPRTVSQLMSSVFTPGPHSMTVTITTTNHQIDFVCGYAIDRLGPAGSNVDYSAQGRLISADDDGLHADSATIAGGRKHEADRR
ncbi:MAG: MBG domain-containing protein [Tepidisphaerales bacterium]